MRPQRPKPRPAPTKPQAKRRRTEGSYRNLDLRPKRLPKLAGARGGKGKKGPLQAWEGNDRFGRRMRAYHRRWKEWLKDYSGLTDAFFGTAQIRLDRCLETKIVGDLQKHLTYGEIASPVLGPKWKGHFVMQWDRQGKVRVRLQKSWGHRKLDNVLTTWATRCMKRVNIPKRLKGKRLWMLTQTKVFARINSSLGKIIGLEEYRDPQTGGLKWKFTHWGQVLIDANTLFLRQRIDP
ncbi:MAG: hypothetical protein EP343_24340 [Deltaproteobacteria bacterium]|nr:MAG: hypothetical protein EP343_24340 [Deltaproteobacteria bacterium]